MTWEVLPLFNFLRVCVLKVIFLPQMFGIMWEWSFICGKFLN